jgi:hypothetical protein
VPDDVATLWAVSANPIVSCRPMWSSILRWTSACDDRPGAIGRPSASIARQREKPHDAPVPATASTMTASRSGA